MKDKQQIRVLMSSYACEPGKGSEPGVGWNMAKAMAGKVKLSVVTRANNQEIIENSEEGWINQVNWIYYDPPKWLTWWKKGGRGVQLFYIIWQIGVYIEMRRRDAKNKYDLIHHVTFGKYWVPSLLVLLDIPFIFGSVGGGEYTPLSLSGNVSKQTLRAEGIKRGMVWLLTQNSLSRRLYRKISLAYAATEETKKALEKLGVRHIQLLPQSGISSDELRHFEIIGKEVEMETLEADFVVCSAARLIPWKGVDIAIQAFIKALPELPERSLFKIAGSGPELERLKQLVNEAGVEDRVIFLGRLPTLDDVYQMMAESDALLHAATSEAFGQACVESLGLGTPVVCWKWAGPGLIVNESCGETVDPLKEYPVDVFAEAIVKMSRLKIDKQKCMETSCVDRVKQKFLWDGIGDRVMEGYVRWSRKTVPESY